MPWLGFQLLSDSFSQFIIFLWEPYKCKNKTRETCDTGNKVFEAKEDTVHAILTPRDKDVQSKTQARAVR